MNMEKAMHTTLISPPVSPVGFAPVTESPSNPLASPRPETAPERPDARPKQGHCQHAGCGAPARPVYLEAGGAPAGWYCDAHRSTAGFCNGCGVYIADRPEHRVTWAFYGRCQACTEEVLG